MTVGNIKRSFQAVEKLMIERDVLNAEVSSKHFNGKLVVLDALDVLAELLYHDLLDD